VQEPEFKNKLMNKAGRLLARRLYSCGEMRLKLARFADEQDVEAILERLLELNLLNDSNYAYNFALYRIRQQGWGPIKVLHSLIRRKVEPVVAQSAIERVRQDENDEAVLSGYLDKAFGKGLVPKDRKDLRKLINHLRQRGFQDDTIYTTLRQKIPATVWRTFDMGD
jgi:SOS response regulatory protein OraA/RecX